jgi:catalase
VRGKPELFADHYSQATLFYRSQTPVEQAHIRGALRWATKSGAGRAPVCRDAAQHRRIAHGNVARDLGMELPEPLPLLIKPRKPEVTTSPALSLFARPGDGGIRSRRIAILVADGVDVDGADVARGPCCRRCRTPRRSEARQRESDDGDSIEVEVTLETMPSVLVDAVAVPAGDAAANSLGNIGQAAEFIVNAYRHCKPILALGAGCELVRSAGVPGSASSSDADPGLMLIDNNDAKRALPAFIDGYAKHRHYARQMDPPPV